MNYGRYEGNPFNHMDRCHARLSVGGRTDHICRRQYPRRDLEGEMDAGHGVARRRDEAANGWEATLRVVEGAGQEPLGGSAQTLGA